MLKKMVAAAAAAMMVASPCLAAELPGFQESGARRSGAVAGAYFKIPLGGGEKAGKPAAGLRMSMVHDYRSASAQTARVVQADSFDLRLIGNRKATLYVAGKPVTGEEAKKQNLTGVGTAVTLVVVVAAAVGAYYIIRAIDDSGEE